MALKIYTRTGDTGHTSLIGGTRVPKSHIRIETYGTVDELNAHIGFCSDQLADTASKKMLGEIQDRLFTIGASLATDPAKSTKTAIPLLEEADIVLLEKEIDRMNAKIPAMTHFILPGGHTAVSSLHIARCICRRTERLCVQMLEENLAVNSLVIKYLNRLSDYLFVLARYSGHLLGATEIAWKPRV